MKTKSETLGVKRAERRLLFTIVELLLVISTISVLLAILMPNLSRAREYAKQTVCMSNLRQIGLGYRGYFHDFNNQMPLIARWLDDFTPIYKYVNSLGVFTCPARNSKYLTSVSQLCGGADYLVSGKITDVEKNCNYNNGHGNNEYNFDPSNRGATTRQLLAAKKDARVIFDSRWDSHFKGEFFNVLYLNDLHHEREYNGVLAYWTLDERGWIDRSLDAFPELP